MPDTHNLNAALYAVLIDNGITEVNVRKRKEVR